MREPVLRGCKYDSEREVPLWDGLAELRAGGEAAYTGSIPVGA